MGIFNCSWSTQFRHQTAIHNVYVFVYKKPFNGQRYAKLFFVYRLFCKICIDYLACAICTTFIFIFETCKNQQIPLNVLKSPMSSWFCVKKCIQFVYIYSTDRFPRNNFTILNTLNDFCYKAILIMVFTVVCMISYLGTMVLLNSFDDAIQNYNYPDKYEELK